MKKKKIVIFDWGGVVESHENNLQDMNRAKIRLKNWTDKTSKNISIAIINNEEEVRDWVQLLEKNMNIDIPLEEFKKAYEEEFSSIKYYKEVVKYAHSLKNKCNIAILSNLAFFDKKRINDQYDLSKFDHVYLSFKIGIAKPNEEIYKYVLQDLKTEPQNILLIDDDTNNILMAKKCGWNTCQAYGYELDKIKESVDSFLN